MEFFNKTGNTFFDNYANKSVYNALIISTFRTGPKRRGRSLICYLLKSYFILMLLSFLLKLTDTDVFLHALLIYA